MDGWAQTVSFLERFEGKKATISKNGLLHLFNRPDCLPQPPQPSSLNPQDQPRGSPIASKQHLQSSARKIVRSEIKFREGKKEPPSSRLSYRTDALRPRQEDKDLELPKLRGRFNNSQQSLYAGPRKEEFPRAAGHMLS
jgi:hypothetical protein